MSGTYNIGNYVMGWCASTYLPGSTCLLYLKTWSKISLMTDTLNHASGVGHWSSSNISLALLPLYRLLVSTGPPGCRPLYFLNLMEFHARIQKVSSEGIDNNVFSHQLKNAGWVAL